MPSSNPMPFTVTRRKPELVAPAKPTPRELKPLSDIDDQESLRFHVILFQIYPGRRDKDTHGNKRDPVRVIREALSKVLVYYYPWAGRLREGRDRKLLVDCTGEGIMFVEADADARLGDLIGENGFLQPPFPCFEELMFDVPGSSDILHCPLILFQVTRLRCGGFVLAGRFNHTMMDGSGVIQFLNAVAEMARGASQPTVPPVWSRELLCSRNPPRVTCMHREYEGDDNGAIFPVYDNEDDNKIIHRSFFFGPNEISALRGRLQPHLRRCSTFELLAAFLWRCRTIALRLDPRDEVRYLCLVNARSKFNPPLPAGYYGNAFAFPAAISTAGKITSNGLDHALELVKKAKAEMTEEYIRSVADLMAARGRPHFKVAGSWIISDNTSFKYLELDFGFGKPVYGGPGSAMVGAAPGPISFLAKAMNAKGETGILLLICLPAAAMERFAREVDIMNGEATSWSWQESRL